MNGHSTTNSTLSNTGQIDPMRAFPDFQSRLSVAQEAAWEASKNLDDLRSRLGVPNDFGRACGPADGLEPGGDVDEMNRAIDRLTDTCRDLRGLAETLNARL